MEAWTENATDTGKGRDDSVRLYLNEIGKYDLLTAEDEVKLAKTIEAGLRAETYLAKRADKLDAAERAKLQVTARHGQEAKKQFINANLRLVVSIAKRYYRSPDLPLLDLIQDGNLGLIRAVEKFEYQKGFKFSTYATWWIRQAIQRAIADKSRTIRLPVHTTDTMLAVHGAQDRLWTRLYREATPEEIAEEGGISIEKVIETQKLDATIVTASLDRSVGDDTNATLGDLLTDPDAVDPGEAAVGTLTTSEHRAKLEEALDRLDERTREIIRMRYGFSDGPARTLDDVGLELNITRERVRQIEKKALEKLRYILG